MNTQKTLALLGMALLLLSLTHDGADEIWLKLAGSICMFVSAVLPVLARWGLIPPGMVNARKRSVEPAQHLTTRDDHGRGDRG